MRWKQILSGCVMVMLAAIVLGASDAKKQPLVTNDTTMPAIELSHQPLEKVLNELKVKLPGFDFSISRENVPHDYPVLPAMTLENVTVGGFCDLVEKEIPGITVTNNQPRSFNGGFEGAGLGGGGLGQPDPKPLTVSFYIRPNPSPPQTTVKVFGLADIIDYRAKLVKGPGDHARKASDDILTLIQTALDETDSAVKPDLKVHDATQTLICKVTEEQEKVITEALRSLQPTEAQLKRLAQQQTRLQGLENDRRYMQELIDKAEKDLAGMQSDSPPYKQAKQKLDDLHHQLDDVNRSATQP